MTSQTSRPTKNILFTGGRAPVTLELARQFHANGNRVYVAESLPFHICQFSNAVYDNITIPAPNDDLEAFGAALSKVIKEHSIDYLIPTCEEVFHISRVKSQLPEQCTVFADDIGKLRKLHSKKEFMDYASGFGLPTPRTFVVTTLEPVHEALRNGRDIVFKKVFSRFSSDTIVLPRGEQDVSHVVVSEETPWVIQDYLGNEQYCTYSIVIEGVIQAHGTYPTTYTAGQGASTYFAESNVEAIYTWIESFMKAIHYTGQISFDFMKTPSGAFMPIECNPRATSGVHLFEVRDRLDRAFLGKNNKLIIPGGERRSMLGLGMLVYGLPKSIKRMTLRRWLGDWFKANDVVFSWKDLLPVLGQFICFAVFIWIALRSKVTVMAASTLDIEWNGHLSPAEVADEIPPGRDEDATNESFNH